MLFLVSTVLGAVSMGSSLLLVGLVMDSPNEGSLFQKWGLPVPVSSRPAGSRPRPCRPGSCSVPACARPILVGL